MNHIAKELFHMPKALRILAADIKAPDHVPAMCLRDSAAMIESLHLAEGDNCTLIRLKNAIGSEI
jgi:hypothetical protein